MNKFSLLVVLSLTMSTKTEAKELLGIQFEFGNWNAVIKNSVTANVSSVPDDQSDSLSQTRLTSYGMNIEKESQRYFGINVNHQLPILPLLRYQQTQLSTNGTFVAENDISFVTTSFTAQSNISTSIDLGYQELTAYYPIFNTLIQLYAGFTKILIDGEIELNEVNADSQDNTENTDSANASAAVTDSDTLLFAQLEFSVPNTALSLSHRVTYRNGREDHIGGRETSVTYRHNGLSTVYLAAGYKKQKFISPTLGEIDSTIFAAGPFVSLGIAL